jgi:membrane protease YdiL (CAAX protease family)
MKPSKVVFEMLLFFLAFFLPGYLSQAGIGAAGSVDTLSMLRVVVTGLPQLLLMLYVANITGGESAAHMGLVALEPRDALRALGLLIGCFVIVSPFVALVSILPPELARSLSSGYRWGLARASQIPVALLFGLTAGYREEFYFRAYMLGRLSDLKLPVGYAVACSTVLFCLGHLYEGPLGIAIAAALGTLFAIAYLRRPNLHVIAIAHGLYNAITLTLSLFLAHALPAGLGAPIF